MRDQLLFGDLLPEKHLICPLPHHTLLHFHTLRHSGRPFLIMLRLAPPCPPSRSPQINYPASVLLFHHAPPSYISPNPAPPCSTMPTFPALHIPAPRKSTILPRCSCSTMLHFITSFLLHLLHDAHQPRSSPSPCPTLIHHPCPTPPTRSALHHHSRFCSTLLCLTPPRPTPPA